MKTFLIVPYSTDAEGQAVKHDLEANGAKHVRPWSGPNGARGWITMCKASLDFVALKYDFRTVTLRSG